MGLNLACSQQTAREVLKKVRAMFSSAHLRLLLIWVMCIWLRFKNQMATFPGLCLRAACGAQLSLGVLAFQHSPQAVQTYGAALHT